MKEGQELSYSLEDLSIDALRWMTGESARK